MNSIQVRFAMVVLKEDMEDEEVEVEVDVEAVKDDYRILYLSMNEHSFVEKGMNEEVVDSLMRLM
jgi:hypothetical protein